MSLERHDHTARARYQPHRQRDCSGLLERKVACKYSSRRCACEQESIEDSSVLWRERENAPGRVSRATGAWARKTFPAR
jgi:hypothetical protein